MGSIYKEVPYTCVAYNICIYLNFHVKTLIIKVTNIHVETILRMSDIRLNLVDIIKIF